MNISEEQTITTTMMMTTRTMITKTKTIAGTTIIKYQKTIQVIIHPIMIMIIIMATPRITMKIIITQKIRNTMVIMLMNLKIMVKMQMTLINLKMIQVQ